MASRLSGREKVAKAYKRSASKASGLKTSQIEAPNVYKMSKPQVKTMKTATQKNKALARLRMK